MQVKRYEAVDMSEAIQLVKKDLGPEAVILSSRKINKGNSKFGLFGRQVVEVTAAIETPAIVRRKARQSQPEPQHEQMAMEPLRAAAATIEPIMDGIFEIREKLNTISVSTKETANPSDRISEDVREMKSMITFLIDQSMEEKSIDEHKNYLALSRLLKDRGISPEYIRGLIHEIKNHAGPGPVPDIKTLINLAAAKMRDSILFDGWIDSDPYDVSSRKVVALIGPTGVGKTTTVAKLASALTEKGRKVGLITIDTYRIAAIEQLKIYAKILNVPLEVVLSPGDLKNALHALRDAEIILIDTAGRSQRDHGQIDDLDNYIKAVPGIETRLTLSASASDRQMEEAIKNFSKAQVDGLIFTKLDEAVTLGAIYNQQARTGLPVSYFTTGQRVPEDIEQASARRLIGGMFKPELKREKEISNYN